MILDFSIDYKTVYGEQLVLNVVADETAETAETTAYRMVTTDGLYWTCRMNIKQADLQPRLDYYYSVFNADGETTHEWLTEAHRLDFSALNGTHYVVYDHWIDIPEDTYLYSSAFTECIHHRRETDVKVTRFGKTLRLAVRAPQLGHLIVWRLWVRVRHSERGILRG